MKNIFYCIAALVIVAACSNEPDSQAPAVDIAAGKNIAQADCAGCHGLDGRGETTEIPNLAAQPSEYLVEALHAYRDGRRQHAALQDLTSDMSEADIANIAGFYASLPPLGSIDEPVAGEGNSYSEGAAVAAACAGCHGANGVSDTAGIPSLAGQQPLYLVVATQEYKNGSRGHVEKEAMLQGLERVDIEKMAMYFASQATPVREAPPFGDPAAGEPLSANCGSCHGARGVSHTPLIPSLASQEPNYLVAAIKAYRSQEREHREMITDKSDQDIENIAAYYAIQVSEPAGEANNSVPELAATCDRCHGTPVGERSLVVPSLNGQSREYLITAMKKYRGADRGSSMMHKMSSSYTDEMIEAIATHYSVQQN
jgi:cytochrome c553